MDVRLEALTKIRGYLVQGWCQKVPAENAEGFDCGALDKAACRWCLTGAMDRVLLGDMDVNARLYEEIVELIRTELFGGSYSMLVGGYMYRWNDNPSRTQEQVVGLLDRVIQKVKDEREEH